MPPIASAVQIRVAKCTITLLASPFSATTFVYLSVFRAPFCQFPGQFCVGVASETQLWTVSVAGIFEIGEFSRMETETGIESDRPRDDEIQAFHNQIRAADAEKLEFVGEKEPLSVLEEEYKAGSPVFLAKLQILKESYGAIRRARGDGNCFFRSFMFSYLEHILETQDEAEAARMEAAIDSCKKTLIDLGYAEFTFEDFLAIFVEQLQSVIEGKETSISLETLVERCRDQYVSDYVVMFFRFVTSGEIRRRAEFFEPFIQGMSNMSVVQFCRSSVEPMGEESDHVHITALSDALGVPVRVVYLDQSGDINEKPVTVNNHDFIPEGMDTAVDPYVILLYRPGHYDILYRKAKSGNLERTALEQTE